MASPPETDPGPKPARKEMGIFDLPDEIQTEICTHCSQCDLIALSLVCSRFRELAAAQLYHNFHIVFPDEDDPCFDSPIDGLAGGLDTFVTSEYNYAKHLRNLSLDTLSAGIKAEAAIASYLAKLSCGKFMNTLLLLTLRRAQLLDTFRWNIRVELSKPVYKQLHSLKCLKHLHIRLQAGPPLYALPPPLPYVTTPFVGPVNSGPLISQWTPPSISAVGQLFGPPPSLLPPPPSYKPTWKPKSLKKAPSPKEPPTVAGFKDLESLSVLDIDNLEVITEIKACVRNSSSTLKKLKLSISDALATQARKPCLDAVEADDSDEDDFQVVPLPSTTVSFDVSGPAKAFRAQEERKVQESLLGRIFEVEPFVAKKYQVQLEDKKKQAPEKTQDQSGKGFIDVVEKMSQRLLAQVHGTQKLNTLDQQEMLETILKAAKKYVDAQGKPEETTTGIPAKDGEPGSSTSGESLDDKLSTPATEVSQVGDGLFKNNPKSKKSDGEANPEDIDVVAPEEQLSIETPEAPEAPSNEEETTAEDTPTRTPAGSSKDTRDMAIDDEDAEKRIIEARRRLDTINRDVADIQHEMNVIEAEMEDANTQEANEVLGESNRDDLRRRISEYARGTRGIGLHVLSIHLIPIKASVLGRAIDLHVLRRITLLNVGPQAPFWVLMNKENQLKPLQLRKIFTDNVSLQFLQFVSELSCLHELLLLERSPKYKPESLASKTKTTVEQIRKFVLKKHMHTLRHLMIKNEADKAWDMDSKTIQLICRRGRELKELAVIMSMDTIHVFIRHIVGLANLRALHFVFFRHDDACLSVLRETRRFVVDAVSHHPELKLEWVAGVGDDERDRDRALRIIRKPAAPKKEKSAKESKKDEDKGKDISGASSNPVLGGVFPTLPTAGWDSPSDSDEDSDDEALPGSKLEIVEGIAFYDVWGVRIFEKEVIAGRL
ncbi:hypothetical protein GGR56DRAFT_623035 [Xylariaceae sp. FL0804]|nr:hypothetical protein GGR56DRAFT_623035 [Xylariaceae sp. FL0804]